MPETIILAIIAVASPIIVGVLKALLSARKVKSGSLERHNEFLHKQLEAFRKYHEGQMDVWRERYEKLHRELIEEKLKNARLQFDLERAREAA